MSNCDLESLQYLESFLGTVLTRQEPMPVLDLRVVDIAGLEIDEQDGYDPYNHVGAGV
jgi:hypothetical protein